MKKYIGRILIMEIAAAVLVLSGCGEKNDGDVQKIFVGNQHMEASVHDPSIVKDGERYYVFGTHMTEAVSDDLISWQMKASGVTEDNPLFTDLFHERDGAYEYVGKYQDGKYAFWAPDVIYNETMEKWTMYFSVTKDYMTSSICMATAENIEGPYTFQERLVESGFDAFHVEQSNFYDVCGTDAKITKYQMLARYNNYKYPNCIDPCVFYDKRGKLYMVYGSWSGGIWLLELDPATGLPIHPETNDEENIDAYFGQYLLGGLHNACEGPYIMYDAATEYYYLFVSYGVLNREGGYQVRLFRSREVTGPYVDTEGQTLGYVKDPENYGLKMMGNYDFPSLDTAYMALGHNSAFRDEDGRYYILYHQRMDNGTDDYELRVHQMFLNEEGWFVTAPFAAMGEKLREKGYRSLRKLAGTYYTVEHGRDISSEIHEAEAWKFLPDGTVETADGREGTWNIIKNTCYITMTLQDHIYKGVIIEMQDEAGNDVRCFTMAGDNNETIWAVFYK